LVWRRTRIASRTAAAFPRLERALVAGTPEECALVILQVALETGGITLRIRPREIQLVDHAVLERGEARRRQSGGRALLHDARGGAGAPLTENGGDHDDSGDNRLLQAALQRHKEMIDKGDGSRSRRALRGHRPDGRAHLDVTASRVLAASYLVLLPRYTLEYTLWLRE
jgi:hypothetical protein